MSHFRLSPGCGQLGQGQLCQPGVYTGAVFLVQHPSLIQSPQVPQCTSAGQIGNRALTVGQGLQCQFRLAIQHMALCRDPRVQHIEGQLAQGRN